MQGTIFRMRFPDYRSALLTCTQPSEKQRGKASDIRLQCRGRVRRIIFGRELDKLTLGLHHNIKSNILRFIKDYILFLGDSSSKDKMLRKSKSKFGVKYRQQTKDNNLSNLAKLEADCNGAGYIYVCGVQPQRESIRTHGSEGDK
ncbi:hypothetical protein BGX33_006606, partial [Mortierella sp. NVP41]